MSWTASGNLDSRASPNLSNCALFRGYHKPRVLKTDYLGQQWDIPLSLLILLGD